MSSKSKQHSQKGKRGPKKGADQAAETAEAPKHEGLEISDEIVHVPKETSALRFILMISLIIVLLVIFIVPQAIMGTVSRPDEGEAFVRWNGPDGEVVEYGYDSFRNEKRILANALQVLSPHNRIKTPEDEELARFLILDQLAASSGMHVPDTDLVATLRQLAQQSYGGVTQYKATARRFGGEQAVEASIRRILRVQRYLQVTALLGSVPSPEGIEELWSTEHEALSYDFGFLSYEDLEAEARAELPADEELTVWLDELDPSRRQPLEVPERRTAQIVSFTSAELTPGAGLVAAFPEEPVEGEEPVTDEERARQYYDQVYFWHFLNPPEETGDTEDGVPPRPTYIPFEEVQDVAMAEAPVYFAMQKWLEALRASEEEADLAALAQEYGLVYEELADSTREELRDLEVHQNVGDTFATRVFQTNAGEYAYSVVARGGALSIVRVTAVTEASLPAFEEIKGDVADLWVDDRKQELAMDKLDGVREAFSAEPLEGESDHEEIEGQEHGHRYADEETFRTALTGLGMDVQRRGSADKALPPASDPALDDAANQFFRTQRQVQGLADDEVSPPLLDPVEGRVYLVRLAGREEVPIANMSPIAFDGYKARAENERRGLLLSEPNPDYLRQEFGLEFLEPVAPEEEGAEGEVEEETEEPSEG